MSMRLQELHPAAVHFPITLLPAALAADAVGLATGNRKLMEVGRSTIPLAAVSAAVAGVLGLVAQQTVELDDESTDLLITHRNLNLGAIALTAGMAAVRRRRRRPSIGYLAAGAAGLATVVYSAYLGGHMVYEHGVGVHSAGGIDEEKAPELLPGTAVRASKLTARHIRDGAAMTASELREGKIAPALRHPAAHLASEPSSHGSGG